MHLPGLQSGAGAPRAGEQRGEGTGVSQLGFMSYPFGISFAVTFQGALKKLDQKMASSVLN